MPIISAKAKGSEMNGRTHRIGTVALAGLALVLAAGMTAPAAAKDKRGLTVMTQNLYVGGSLAPIGAATTPFEFLLAAATLYSEVQFTDFPARANAIAAEIEANGPDVIALQEVTTWTSTGPGAPPSLDFLAILQQDLVGRGLSYSVGAVSTNASVGPVPLLLCSGALGSCLLSLQDRDVILVNDNNPSLQTFNPQNGRYVAQQVQQTPAGPLSFNRGWASIEGTLDGKSFRFATTHLEIEQAPAIQEAQGNEFLAGPAKGGAVIAAGDFNSAADGSTTATYANLTKSWFRDAWDTNPGDPGLSCCQIDTLTNLTSAYTSRIDLVLTHGASRAIDAKLVGDSPFQPTAPFWPSDHAGLVVTIRLQ
jgi:endonuclease/exonuclease/phosphatase family metal-dependent hydrolase